MSGRNLYRAFKSQACLSAADAPLPRPAAHVRHATAKARREPQVRQGALRTRRHEPHPEHLLPRLARHGRCRSRRYGCRVGIVPVAVIEPWRDAGALHGPAVCRYFRSAPGRIRTSDSRFRKPSRFVYPCSPGLEIRCSYIQARAAKKLSYVAWDLGADGAAAA
jgi:hypothetical protein